MREWKVWDWIAYTVLFVAAVILALDTGLRMSPDLMAKLHIESLHSPWWGFAPFGLMLLASIIFVIRAFAGNTPPKQGPRDGKGGNLVAAREKFRYELQQRAYRNRLTLTGAPAQSQNKTSQPNMRLEDVLKHITGIATLPGPNETGSEKIWRTCENIREKALNGLINVFGGIDFRSTKPADYDAMVRALIPAEFWKTHRIDVIEFLGNQDRRGMTVPLSPAAGRAIGANEYYGIWFDRNQIDGLQIDSAKPEFMAAKDAIILINDGLRGSKQADYIFKWTDGYPSEKEKLEFAVMMLSASVPLYGIKPLTSMREKINMDNLQISVADLTDNCSVFRKMNNKDVLYSDLAFRRAELEAFIQEILAEG